MSTMPLQIRRATGQAYRAVGDWISGRSTKFAIPNTTSPGEGFPIQLSLEQPIFQTQHVESKIHNIQLAVHSIENRIIAPQQIFSFWRLVGLPEQKRGFRAGRSLLGGKLVTDFGGGLCQLSGILYHLSLQGGLEILERHSHTIDIYSEEKRYTPLGADATVAWGLKDLRVVNSLQLPFRFSFELQPEKLIAHLCSPAKIKRCEVEFLITEDANGRCSVQTQRKNSDESAARIINISQYRRQIP